MHVRDDLDLLGHVVEHEQALGEEQTGVGEREVVRGTGREPLERARHVVADVADRTTGEAGQTGDGDRPVFGQERLQRTERIGRRVPHRPAPRRLDLDRPAPRAEDARGLRPEEAVPAPLLTPLDALQEEAVRAAMDLEERRHRRFEVGEDLAAHGDQVALAGELAEVGARRRGRPGAERQPSGGPAGRDTHSDATNACSTPSCSRSLCIAAVA